MIRSTLYCCLVAAGLSIGLRALQAGATPPPPPVITEILPPSGPPGAYIQIAGENLQYVTRVLLNDQELSFGGSIIPGNLSLRLPEGITTGFFTVESPGGVAVSPTPFVVTAVEPPILTGFSPESGLRGTIITLFGTNILNDPGVEILAVAIDQIPLQVLPADAINPWFPRALISSNAVSGPVTIVTTGGTASTERAFTVLANRAPEIRTFSPRRGPAGTTVVIRVTEADLATAVRFGGVPAPFRITSPESIEATVPANGLSGPITVQNTTGSTESLDVFVVRSEGACQAAVPAAGPFLEFEPIAGSAGTTIRLRIPGEDLTQATQVWFDGFAARFEIDSGDLLAELPDAALCGPVMVRTPSGVYFGREPFEQIPDSELRIRLVSAPERSALGGSFTAVFQATNSSPSVLNNARVSFSIPQDLESIGMETDRGEFQSGPDTLEWLIGNLAAGESGQASLHLRSIAKGTAVLEAVLTADGLDPAIVREAAIVRVTIVDPTELTLRLLPSYEVELVWPASEAVLYTTDTLSLEPIWEPVPGTPEPSDGWNRMILPTSEPSRFWRLRRLDQ